MDTLDDLSCIDVDVELRRIVDDDLPPVGIFLLIGLDIEGPLLGVQHPDRQLLAQFFQHLHVAIEVYMVPRVDPPPIRRRVVDPDHWRLRRHGHLLHHGGLRRQRVVSVPSTVVIGRLAKVTVAMCMLVLDLVHLLVMHVLRCGRCSLHLDPAPRALYVRCVHLVC